MRWTVGVVAEKHDYRPDRPRIHVPWIQEDEVTLREWVEVNPKTMNGGGPVAFIDAETWRDFDKPVLFGMVILDRVGGQEAYPCGGEYGENGEIIPTPHKWSWNRCEKHKDSHHKSALEKCPDCVRVKPATYGQKSSRTNVDERVQRLTRAWCWSDELETHFIPLLMERNVKTIYAHNATVDLIAMLSQIESELLHPLELFVQTDHKERSRLLFKGSTVLQAQLDFARYYNRHNPTPYARKGWCMKQKKMTTHLDYPVKMLDSLGVLPLRLHQIGTAVGFPKGSTPEKFTNTEHPDFGNVMSITDDDIRYCIQDCEVLFHGLNQFFQMAKELGYHGTTLPLTSGTLGSQMIARANIDSGLKPVLYEKKKGAKKYSTIVNQPDLDDIGRRCLVGGRTQTFESQIMKKAWFKSDANSFYPSVMVPSSGNRYPDFRHQQGVKNPDEINSEVLQNMEGCAFIHWVRPKSDEVGLLSGRNDDGLLDWTLFEDRRWVTFPEIRRAVELGYEVNFEVCPDTDYCAIVMETLPYNPFACVQSWYDKRIEMKAAKDPREFAVKILLNSGGFGKFVERNRDSIITTEDTWAFMEGEWDFSAVAGDDALMFGYAQGEFKRAATTANIMGSYITAYARLELHRLMTEIGSEHLLYCDTDSIAHTNAEIPCPMEGDNLGEWKLEQMGDYWWSPAPKQYKYRQTWDEKNGECVKWNALVKGCSLKKAADRLGVDWNTFCEELDLKGTVTFERVLSIKESWRKPDPTMTAGKWIVQEKNIGGN